MEKQKELKSYHLIKCKIVDIKEPVRGNVELTFRDISGTYPQFTYFIYYDASEGELEYKLNEIHEVYYYEKDTSKNEIKDFFSNYETSGIMLIIGFVFLLDFPMMLFVVNLNKKRQLKNAGTDYTSLKDSVISE
jgi:hypothetical protein